jgi:hypothetical protein
VIKIWILRTLDYLFGEALDNAPRCEECCKIAKVSRCQLKHRSSDQDGRCMSMFCDDCNSQKLRASFQDR